MLIFPSGVNCTVNLAGSCTGTLVESDRRNDWSRQTVPVNAAAAEDPAGAVAADEGAAVDALQADDSIAATSSPKSEDENVRITCAP